MRGQPHIKLPFHRLLLSKKHILRKGLLSKELNSVNIKIQSKYVIGKSLTRYRS